MKTCVNLLHLSDIHARQDRERELSLRFKALARDLVDLDVKPNLILVTGDIAYYGKSEEYMLAQRLINDFCTTIGVKKKIFICPGNHDIERSKIDPMTERGLQSELTNSLTAEKALDHEVWTLPQQKAYITFVNEITEQTKGTPSRSELFEFGKVPVGVASFNSAWRCSDDNCKEKLFLTLRQVHALSDCINDAQLRIALLHHPFDWYHPDERAIVQKDLMRRFDLILTGHLHVPESALTKTPAGESLVYTVPSFFDGQIEGITDGYNIYSVDLDLRHVHTFHRKFIRQRESYDRYVEHSRNGESEFDLPHRAFSNLPSAPIMQKITATANSLEVSIRDSLQLAQHISTPIFVKPLVEQVVYEKGSMNVKMTDEPFSVAAENPTVIYGPPDVGTTILVKGVCAHIIGNNHSRFAVYFDHAEIAITALPGLACEKPLGFVNCAA